MASYWQVAATTQPNIAFIGATRLTQGASVLALQDQQWFWSSNVLYLRYDAGNPDSQGITVEAGQRDYCLDQNSNTGIAIRGVQVQRANQSAADGFQYGGIRFHGASKCNGAIVTGCTVKDCNNSGIYFDPNTDSVTVTNNTVTGCGWHGINFNNGIGETNVTITGNTLTNNGWQTVINYPCGIIGAFVSGIVSGNIGTGNGAGGGGGHSHGLYQNGSPASATVTISGNTFTGHTNGVGIKATASCTITGNVCDSNGWGGLNLGPNSGSTNMTQVVTFNTLSNNASAGGAGVDVIVASGTFALKCYNNVLYKNSGGSSAGEVDFEGALTSIDWRNNIISANGSGSRYIRSVAQTGTVTIDYNDYFNGDATPFVYNSSIISFATWQAEAFTPDAHSLASDPLFVNPSAGNFHLGAGSPAIKAGVFVAGVNTYNPPDMGIYEGDGQGGSAGQRRRRFIGAVESAVFHHHGG